MIQKKTTLGDLDYSGAETGIFRETRVEFMAAEAHGAVSV